VRRNLIIEKVDGICTVNACAVAGFYRSDQQAPPVPDRLERPLDAVFNNRTALGAVDCSRQRPTPGAQKKMNGSLHRNTDRFRP